MAASFSVIHNLIGPVLTQSTLHPKIYLVFQIVFLAWSILSFRYPPEPGIAVLLLAIVATILTIQPNMSDKYRLVWILIILVLAFVEFKSIDRARYLYDLTRDNATRYQTNNFKAISRGIDQAIQDSQEQFAETLARSDKIMENSQKTIELGQQAIEETTGGNGWCYLRFSYPDPANGELVLVLISPSKHIIRGLQVRMVDYNRFRTYFSNHSPAGMSERELITKFAKIVQKGDVPPDSAGPFLDFGRFDDKTDKDYRIEFRAMNGFWREILRFHKIDGKWEEAIKVDRIRISGFGSKEGVGETATTILKKVSPGYPRKNGKVDWIN